jgi:hypothetical protein
LKYKGKVFHINETSAGWLRRQFYRMGLWRLAVGWTVREAKK